MSLSAYTLGMKTLVRIYTLSDPRTDRVRYVGRTVNRLSRRLNEHVRTATRGKLKDKTKEIWIMELRALGLSPRIDLIQDSSRECFREDETRWIAHYRTTHLDLLNLKRGGDGGFGGHFVKWTPELDTLLGKIADSRIAEQMGVSRKTVTYRRDKLNIPASHDRTRNVAPPANGGFNKIEFTADIEAALGKEPDHLLAARAGVEKTCIARRRVALGIESFADASGNTSRFGARIKTRKIELDDPKLSVLGTMTDKNASVLLSLSHSRTATIRNLLGIPSYRKTNRGFDPSQKTNGCIP